MRRVWLAIVVAVVVAWAGSVVGLSAQARQPGGNPKAAAVKNPVKPTPAIRSTGDSDGSGTRIQPPRWHSFLPGMFR